MPVQYLKLGHDRLLADHFQFFTHWSSYCSTLPERRSTKQEQRISADSRFVSPRRFISVQNGLNPMDPAYIDRSHLSEIQFNMSLPRKWVCGTTSVPKRTVSTRHARQVSCARRVLRSQGQGSFFASFCEGRALANHCSAVWVRKRLQPRSTATSLTTRFHSELCNTDPKHNNVSCQIHTGSLIQGYLTKTSEIMSISSYNRGGQSVHTLGGRTGHFEMAMFWKVSREKIFHRTSLNRYELHTLKEHQLHQKAHKSF
jgi:hypothetical protein